MTTYIKEIAYKGKRYEMEIAWTGESYAFRIINVSNYKVIPSECLNDIEKIKPFFNRGN